MKRSLIQRVRTLVKVKAWWKLQCASLPEKTDSIKIVATHSASKEKEQTSTETLSDIKWDTITSCKPTKENQNTEPVQLEFTDADIEVSTIVQIKARSAKTSCQPAPNPYIKNHEWGTELTPVERNNKASRRSWLQQGPSRIPGTDQDPAEESLCGPQPFCSQVAQNQEHPEWCLPQRLHTWSPYVMLISFWNGEKKYMLQNP